MRRFYQYILAVIALSGLACCTHNNGDIGDLFGTWKLDKITIDGEVDRGYGDDILWKFQSSIIEMEQVNDALHETFKSHGSWSRPEEGLLVLDFTHTDNDNPEPGSEVYSPLPATHLPSGCKIDMDLLQLDGSKMELRYIDPLTTKVYEYYFKKW